MSPKDSISMHQEYVVKETEGHPHALNTLANMVDSHVAWATWDSIEEIIAKQQLTFKSASQSTTASINRLCNVIIDAINRHR